MTENARGLTPAIRAHLQGLLRSSGLPETPETAGRNDPHLVREEGHVRGADRGPGHAAAGRVFPRMIPAGPLLLTWSGLPPQHGARRGRPRREENGIREHRAADGCPAPRGFRGWRTWSPDLAVGEAATLRGGPIASTSALLTIAACDPSVTAEEQEKRIREATIFLTNGFVKINRTVTRPGVDFPEQLTIEDHCHLPGAEERAEPEADAAAAG